MSNLFSDLEGLRIAMEIEQIGAAFYQKASEHVNKPELKEALQFLTGEENKHFATFTALYEKIKNNKEYAGDEYLFDPEASRYLTVLAEGHIFPQQARVVTGIEELGSVEEILAIAVQAEKDSIMFFTELAAEAKFEETSKIFLALQAEEKGHLVKLRVIIDSLAKNK